jgi:hypothetical protein
MYSSVLQRVTDTGDRMTDRQSQVGKSHVKILFVLFRLTADYEFKPGQNTIKFNTLKKVTFFLIFAMQGRL